MWNATRSELVRLARPRYLAGWFGLMALFTVLINSVMFSTVSDAGALPEGGPGVAFPDAATLASQDGLMAGLSAASSMFGVVTLAFWAIAAASDYSSGLVRLLVSAQPRRWKLVFGKTFALAILTAAATAVAAAVNVGLAPAMAQAAGFDPEAWADGAGPVILGAWLNAYLALIVWGIIGLVLAVVTRSAAVAISVGVGWVLVVESVFSMAFDGGLSGLPGNVLTALAQGGNGILEYGQALGVGLLYAVVGLAVALVIFTRRDVTD